MRTWRRANYKMPPKLPPHIVRISKQKFFESFPIYDDEIEEGESLECLDELQLPIHSKDSVLLLQKNLTKITVVLNNYYGRWSKYTYGARLYVKGHDIAKYFRRGEAVSRYEPSYACFSKVDGKFMVASSFAPHFRAQVQRVTLMIRVDVPLHHVEPVMDKTMREMGIIDLDGDYLYQEDDT